MGAGILYDLLRCPGIKVVVEVDMAAGRTVGLRASVWAVLPVETEVRRWMSVNMRHVSLLGVLRSDFSQDFGI